MNIERTSSGGRSGYDIQPSTVMAFRLVQATTPKLSLSTVFDGLEHEKLRDNCHLLLVFRYRFLVLGKILKIQKPGAQTCVFLGVLPPSHPRWLRVRSLI